MAVAILLAVRLVVLAVVGDEVVEREPVVRGDEVDRRPRLAAALVEQVGGAVPLDLADQKRCPAAGSYGPCTR
jgi:hypothetical protein